MISGGKYPSTRLRRTRRNIFSRNLVRETVLTVEDLVYPIFVVDGKKKLIPVDSMPGIHRISLDNLDGVANECLKFGIPAIALFPYIDEKLKTDDGRESFNDQGLIARAVRLLKINYPELGVITDAALDPYTTHGQDGLVDADGHILNDETVVVLEKQAICCANAGADVIAPSDMMDGRISKIRNALESSNLKNTLILSYASKFASSFYGPFRSAVGSSMNLGTKGKATYQLDFSNINEALREVEMDIEEGADIVMVKPGMPYLDVVRAITDNYLIPTFVYQVSGEYAMLKGAFKNQWLPEKETIIESLTCFKRAGASAILTYFALDAAKALTSSNSAT